MNRTSVINNRALEKMKGALLRGLNQRLVFSNYKEEKLKAACSVEKPQA